MAMTATELYDLIAAGIPGATVEIQDLAGDGEHFKAIVTSPAFVGKSRVAQHQMVYTALGGRMHSTLHALAIETRAIETRVAPSET